MELIPDINNKDQTFTIIDNDHNTITIDSADGDLTQAIGVDDTYSVMAVFDGHLIIRNTPAADIDGNARLGNLSVVQGSGLRHPYTNTNTVYYIIRTCIRR